MCISKNSNALGGARAPSRMLRSPPRIFAEQGSLYLQYINFDMVINCYGTGGDADDRERGRPLVKLLGR